VEKKIGSLGVNEPFEGNGRRQEKGGQGLRRSKRGRGTSDRRKLKKGKILQKGARNKVLEVC